VFLLSLDYFVLVLFAFVVLGLVSSVLRQEIDWEERLRNYLFSVKEDRKPLIQSIGSPSVHFSSLRTFEKNHKYVFRKLCSVSGLCNLHFQRRGWAPSLSSEYAAGTI